MKIKIPLLKIGDSTNSSSQCFLSYERTISYPGEQPCVLVFSNDEVGEHEFSGLDIFDCLRELRRFLESKNLRILCNGSRVDTYPSGMSRSMGGGFKLYVHKLGSYPQRSDLVKIFDEAESSKIGTVEEQYSYYQSWLKSVNSQFGDADGFT